MSFDSYVLAKDRLETNQQLVQLTYAEIYKHSLLVEEKVTELLQEISTDFKQFYKIHSIIDFRKVNTNFYKFLCRIVIQLEHSEEIQVSAKILLYKYKSMILELISKKKEIYSDIVLNALQNPISQNERKINLKEVIDNAKL